MSQILKRMPLVRQGPPSPIHADIRKEAMFNLVPLARARREVAHRDLQLVLIGQLLEFSFPEAHPVAVAAAAVRADE